MSGLDEFRCFFLKVHTWSIVDTTGQKKKNAQRVEND